jgi:hypothetical protein
MTLDPKTIQAAEHKIRSSLNTRGSLERLCQSFAKAVYEQFSESVVMIRTFAVLRFGKLAPESVEAVRDIVGTDDDVQPHAASPIHTLLGTYGCEEEWRDRHRSRRHKAVPLLNREMVSRVPMMSRLLNELGLGLDWLDRPEDLDVSVVGSLSGLFHVKDPANAKDERGRLIIADQDFVAKYGVRSVFGNAMLISLKEFLVTIVFTRVSVDRRTAGVFLELGADLGPAGSRCMARGQVFEGQ